MSIRMNAAKSYERYKELFDDAAKIAAFDKIAEEYYCMNFGSMSKTDLDTLMFSLYIERILEKDQVDISQYSDYTLSKYLGITQSKVSSLKVRKELLYPYSKFNWKVAFSRFAKRAVYDGKYIKLYLPDRNVYLEVKNAIETMGGFVEVQLTANLLQVRPEYFVDLLIEISDEEDKDRLRKRLEAEFMTLDGGIRIKDGKFADSLAEKSMDALLDCFEIVSSVIPSPFGVIAQCAITAIKRFKA